MIYPVEIKLALSDILGLCQAVMRGKDYAFAIEHMRLDFEKRFPLDEVIKAMYASDTHSKGIVAILAMLQGYSRWRKEDFQKEHDRLTNETDKFWAYRLYDLTKTIFKDFKTSPYFSTLMKVAGSINELNCFHRWISDGDIVFNDHKVKAIYQSRHPEILETQNS